MKSRLTRTKKTWIGMLLVALLLTSCTSVPAGQIKGTLVANGKPLKGYPIAIALIPSGQTQMKMARINTDKAGNFSVENAQAGNYMILLASMGGPTGISFEAVLKDGKIYTFELPEGQGVDLGTVDASSTQPYP
jgi:hypothetical protein